MYNVLQLLEATAHRLPHKVAVADPSSSLTFGELHQVAQSIGTWLSATASVTPRSAVAFYLEKSPLALAAMLGTVYAGAYYSIIDVRQPAVRVLQIAESLFASSDNFPVVLTDRANEEQAHEFFDSSSYRVACIEDLVHTPIDNDVLGLVRASVVDTDPLYVNYTSGSTGTPKGVVVCHRSVLDFIPIFVQTFDISEHDIIANQAPFDFDVSVKDIYSCLLTGATLRIVPRPYFTTPAVLMDYLCDNQVTTLIWGVSALCFVSIMGGFEYRVPESIARVLFSGEVMPPKQLGIWQKYLPQARFVNLYGPTEITCNCTYFEVTRSYEPSEFIPMGCPFPNEKVFLLDEHARLVPPSAADVVGEVCVAGTCLALGYLRDAERTSQVFTQNPLNTCWQETMYRTGDLAKYDASGNLVFVSRKDHQIKHMGQRIELGDIEAVTQGIDGVQRACCLYDSRRKRIVLCYVGDIERKPLKASLRELLPSYMIPNNTKKLDQLPMSKNGKIDRAALAKSVCAQW